MISNNYFLIFLLFTSTGCEKSDHLQSHLLPENVKNDKPIIIKEGQAIVLVPEGKEALMLAVTVHKNDLLISEIDPDGKSLSVTWHDEESWTTSIMDSTEGRTITVVDKDGDGIPDIRAVMENKSLSRYRIEETKWIELK